MSRLKAIAGIVLGGLLLLFGAGFLLPAQVHVERSVVIQAPTEQVFAQVSDFNAWDTWSPWAKLDPDASMEIRGSGLGQTMVWSSDVQDVGTGRQVITALDAPHHLGTHLDFGGQGIADAAFDLEEREDATQVTWSLDTDMRAGVPLLMKPVSSYFGLAMDSMIGNDYEQGLQNLKTIVEAAA